MRKVLFVAIAFAFILSVAGSVYAADFIVKPVEKLANGTVEVIKSPLALYDVTKDEMDGHDYKSMGLLKGLIVSPFHVVKRAGEGVIDIATFPIGH